MRIQLSDADYDECVIRSKSWTDECRSKGWKLSHGMPESQRDAGELIGFLGEVAFRRLFGDLGFPVRYRFKNEPDALGCEVRTTKYEWGRLIMRDNDPTDRPYVLMVGQNRLFRCAGYRMGWERKHFKKSGRTLSRPAAWFISQAALRHPNGLWMITREARHRNEMGMEVPSDI